MAETNANRERKKRLPTEELSSNVSSRAGHNEQVFNWRKDAFIQIGFKLERAEFLADTNIETEAARKLHSKGCPLHLIEEILLGTDFAGEDARWYRADAETTIEYDDPDPDDTTDAS